MLHRIIYAYFLLLVVFVPICYGFLAPFSHTRTCTRQRHQLADDDEPDLFEYFDPLLSPHEYPNGISPDQKPGQQSESQPSKPKQPFGLELMSNQFPAEFVSPPEELAEQTAKNKFKTSDRNNSEVDLFDVFDPTLSPHAYPNGIPSIKKRKKTLTVGILLMDHGSRNDASNERLHEMARLYQNIVGDPERVIVKAAHMEIASPTIPEQLQKFADLGVDEIICHPYFLSPGRHVKEDIPRILQDAIENLGLDIPMVTTSPVGSHTKLMINAIHSLVEEKSAILSQHASKGRIKGPTNSN